jgi:two-component system sensor histidine kinase KdpD
MLRQDNPLAKLLEELKERFALDSISIFDTSEKGRYNLIASFGDSPPLTPGDAKGVIKLPSNTVVAFNSAKGLEADDQRLMQAFCSHLCLAVDTLHLKEEKAQAEASLASDALRTALLAAVSHDLRTPLATIKTSADGLLQPDSKLTKEEVKELLMTIDREADRLNSLVANLLDASRLQTGVLNVTLQEVGLDEIVPAALAGIQERGRRLLVKVPEDLPRIKTDPVLLERAVVNIVDNAIAYSNVGASVRIEAGVVETLEGGFAEASRVDYARSAWTAPMSVKTSVDLRIIDTGPGIQRLDQDRVFSPFERLGNVPMGNGLGEDGQTGGGLGLGLAVAKGFVEAVGAKLSLEDTPGGGCVMIISLPIAKDNTPVTPGNTADPITEGHHSSGR